MIFRFLRLLFAPVRWFARAAVPLYDRAFSPKPLVQRSTERQASVDREASSLLLFHFHACPFCVKVRHHARRLGLALPMKDARRDPDAGRELVAGGGELQVPCLRIPKEGGGFRWLYESSDINAYLSERFGS